MADTFRLRIFTPEGLLREEVVSSVTLPSTHGEIGVLTKHTKYTGVLGSGALTFTVPSGEKNKIEIAGGFCTFSAETLVILADSVLSASSASAEDRIRH